MISATTHIARLARAAFVLAREGVFGIIDPSLVPPPGQIALRLARLVERRGAKSGPRLSRALERMGPAYLKLGQFLATRPDVVGLVLARDLESLQDRLPPFPQNDAEAAIATALERPITQAFASFGPAVAAASIAQVHRGEVLRNGARHAVAVKVLRPNVASRFRRDLSDFFYVAHKAETYSAEARRLRLVEVINTMSRSVSMEMDLRLEGAALSEMAENTRNDPDFRVPAVDWDRTAHNVLTLEWVDGIALSDHARLVQAKVDLPDLGRKVIQSFLRHALRDGFFHALVIGTASVAPAYSLAATLGFVALVPNMGVHAPGIMILAFVPMLLIAAAYKYLNRADPDCGTTFAWVTRALGPSLGWINGWAIFIADVIVMASLADIAARYSYQLFGWGYGNEHIWIVIAGSVLWIVLMTWICHRGIELSARLQQALLSFEVIMLLIFAGVALAKVYSGHPTNSITIQPSWFNPFGGGTNAMVDGVLLAVFIYWGWDSGVAVNEETEDPREGPGVAAILSTILLVLIYVVVSCAAQSYHGLGFLTNPAHSEDVLTPLGSSVLGSVGFRLLIIAILCSASSSTQTTILPTARTTLSMARWGAIPKIFGEVHPRFKTPTASTLGMGLISVVWTVGLLALNPNEDVLGDAITALGFSIAFYYGFTGVACVVYFRRFLTRSVKDFVLLGLSPTIGALMLFAIFVKAAINYGRVSESYSPPILGIPTPLFIGFGGLLIGVVLMLIAMPYHREYFKRKLEVPDENGYAPYTIAPEDETSAAVAPSSA